VLVPSRGALAVALRQLAETRTPLAGASDHGVSEALYLSDPEGNGIEIYRDRPRDEWPWRDGRLAMGTRRLALESLIAEAETGVTGDLPEGTVIGHVHLRVADVAAAEVFYGDVLGFSLMQRYGDSASFVSAGGYHHHIAFNTWESLGASPAAPDSAGLDHFELLLPDETARAQVVERLAKRGSAIGATPLGPSIRDPSGNALVLRLADS